jgi:hypothetical protein
MDDFEIAEVESELEPLFRALLGCRVKNNRALALTLERLSKPPETFYLPPPSRVKLANSLLKEIVPFDHAIATSILPMGHRASVRNSEMHSRAEYKRAKRRWDRMLNVGLESSSRGRPAKIDGALVVYCARIIAEASEKPRFKISRPANGGTPQGPMFRALMESLSVAQTFLVRAYRSTAAEIRTISKHAVAEIVTTMRWPEFEACCRKLGIGTTAHHVAQNPESFRAALACARAQRRGKLRPKLRRRTR